MRISDWSSDVCSSDLICGRQLAHLDGHDVRNRETRRLGPENQTSRGKPSVFGPLEYHKSGFGDGTGAGFLRAFGVEPPESGSRFRKRPPHLFAADLRARHGQILKTRQRRHLQSRSEEHTSELQSLMRTSYAVFCLKKKKTSPT